MKNDLCRSVVFDLDGTLLDTLADLTRCVNETLAHFALPERTPEQIRAALGNGSRELIRLSLSGREELLPEALRFYRGIYPPKVGAKTAPYPGIVSLTERLQREGWRLAILSNKPHGAVLSLRDAFFPSVRWAAGDREGVPRKPDPAALFALMEEMGAAPEKTVYVGDSEVDVALAERAGLSCAAVCWGYRDRKELEEAGAEKIASDAAELYRLLTAAF